MSLLAEGVASRLVEPARPSHVPDMTRLIAGHAARGLMLPRSQDELANALRDFVVVRGAAGVLATGGLRYYETGAAEVIGLAVGEGVRGTGLGRRVVEALRERARNAGAQRLFALTLEPSFFRRLGFAPLSFSSIPEKVRRDCIGCRFRTGCRETPVGMELRRRDDVD